ncbi:MAG: hypothetical protein K6U74_20755, partial [Firmicutes bacterium]|nr:hypothetical protein [Bacillota bacterium]
MKKVVKNFYITFILPLLVTFLLCILFAPLKGEAGSLVDPGTYARLKDMSQGYFTKLLSEMAERGISPEEAEKIIFNYVKDLDAGLQAKLQAGTLNETNFDNVFGSINIELMFKPAYKVLLFATLDMLNLGDENPLQVIQDIMSGKRPLPDDLRQFLEAVKEAIFSNSEEPDSPGGGSGGSAPEQEENKKLLGREGGKLAAYNGKVNVEVPPGALDSPVEVSIVKIKESEAPTVPQNFRLASDIYKFSPPGKQFSKSVTMILQYEPSKLDEEKEQPAVYCADVNANTWVAIGGTTDKQKHTV